MDEPLPGLLTVEEAAELLRVGRTKAYAMAKEWRATGGRSGLPVVDFGRVLRVPLRALEALVGTELTPPARTAVTTPPPESTGRAPRTPPVRRGSMPRRRSDQLTLIHAEATTTTKTKTNNTTSQRTTNPTTQ